MSKSKQSIVCLVILLAMPLMALAQRGGKSAAPTVSSISPASATAGGAGFTLTVDGSNFTLGSVVRWNGANLTTTYVSSAQLQASIPSALVSVAGTAQITAFTSGRGGGTSNGVAFTISAASTTTTTSTSTTTSTTTTTTTPSPTPLAITTASVPSGTAGTAYSTTLAASGGTSPYAWSISSGALAPGLTLATAGGISQTPTTAGSYAFTARVTDSASQTSTYTYSLTIAAAATTPPPTTTVASGVCINGTYGVCGDPYEGAGAPANQQPISACGITISASGNYKVSQDIGTNAAATCITITYNTNRVNLDLGGHTVTGAIFDVSGNGNTVYNGTITCNKDTSSYPQTCLQVYNQITSAQWRAHHLTMQNQHEAGGVWTLMTEMDSPGSYAGGGSGLGMPCRIDHTSMTSITGTGIGNRYGFINNQGYCNVEEDHNYLHCTGGSLEACQGMGAGITPYAYIHDNYILLDPVSSGIQDGRGLICDSGAGVNGTCDMYNNIIYATNNRAIRFRQFPPTSGQGGQWGIQRGNVYNNFIYNIQVGGRLAAIHIGEDDFNLMTTAINIYNNSLELNNGNGIVVVSANGVTALNNAFTCYGGTCGSASIPMFTDALGYSGGQTNAYFKNNVIPAGITNGVKVCGPPGNASYGCSSSETTAATVCATGNAVGNGRITANAAPCQ